MINNNITLAFAAIISITCMQHIDAAHKKKPLPLNPYQALDQHTQERETLLTNTIDKKMSQWYNQALWGTPDDPCLCTRSDCNEAIVMSYAVIPSCIGATICNSAACLIGSTLSCFCAAFCIDCVCDTRLIAPEDIEQWYSGVVFRLCRDANSQICQPCDDGCTYTRADCVKIASMGWSCASLCAGTAATVITHSPLPNAIGAAACLLCLVGCNRWNNPDHVAQKEKSQLARLQSLFTH